METTSTETNKSRSRGWVFTVNNYTPEHILFLRDLQCEYLVAGKEVGQKEHTPHLQGYVLFKNAKTFNQIKALLPSAHIEAQKGTDIQAARYCMKDGDIAVEKGKLPQQGKRTDLEESVKLLKDKGITAIVELQPEAYIKFGKGLRDLDFQYKQARVLEHQERKVYWLWGPTGTGKTRWAVDYSKDKTKWLYGKKDYWFDGYYGQQVAIFDDVRPDDIKYQNWLTLLDCYIVTVPIKGGYTIWNPETVIITCPVQPRDFFSLVPESLAQVLRRITEIIQFPIPESIPDSQPIPESQMDLEDL